MPFTQQLKVQIHSSEVSIVSAHHMQLTEPGPHQVNEIPSSFHMPEVHGKCNFRCMHMVNDKPVKKMGA